MIGKFCSKSTIYCRMTVNLEVRLLHPLGYVYHYPMMWKKFKILENN